MLYSGLSRAFDRRAGCGYHPVMRVPTPIKSLLRGIATSFYAFLEVTGLPKLRQQRESRKERDQ